MSVASEVSTADFLSWLLPDEGHKVVCIFTHRDRPPRQQFCRSAEEAAAVALNADAAGLEVYHACAIFIEPGSRTQRNALGACAFWQDVDCGPGKAYPSAIEGYRAVMRFVVDTGLPLPLVVASGAGLHVYWALDRVVDPATWHAAAVRLRDLCTAHGLLVDPSRSADLASILRPPGTHNRKYGAPVLVQCGELPEFVDADWFVGRINGVPATTAPIHRGATAAASRGDAQQHPAGQAQWVNAAALGGLNQGGPPPSMTQGYPEGGRTTEMMRRVGWCLGQWHMGPEAAVASLLAWNAYNTPPIDTDAVEKAVWSIHERELAKLERVEVSDEPVEAVPYPFYFSPYKQLMRVYGAEGQPKEPVVVYKAPLYVLGYRRPESGETRTVALRHWLPHDGWNDIVVPWDDTSLKTVSTRLTARGLNLYQQQMPHILYYVQKSIDEMQQHRATALEYEQLGWKGSAFLLGHELYDEGQSSIVGVGPEARQRADMLKPMGTYQAWAAAANKLFAKGFEGQALMLLCSFAAPLMRFRLEAGGVIVSGVSEGSGTGKTTAIEAVASVWGDRNALDINRTDTQNSRFRSIALLANLPVVFDEMRNRDPEVVKDFILSFTDGRDKNRLNQDGTLRRLSSGWSTILISAANVSLAETVAYDNETAQAARVLEFIAKIPDDVEAADGKQMIKDFKANRGNAGRQFIQQLVRKDVLEWCARATDQYDREYAAAIGAKTETRFYSSLLACVKVASLLLRRWNMLEFDDTRIMDFALAAAHGMKAHIAERRMSAVDVLGTFVNEHWGTCLVMATAVPRGGTAIPLQVPKAGHLYMRLERQEGALFIDRVYLRKWCVKNKVISSELEAGLRRAGVLKTADTRRQLGHGTPYAGGPAVICWHVDALHPVVGGMPRLVAVEEGVA